MLTLDKTHLTSNNSNVNEEAQILTKLLDTAPVMKDT